MVGKRENLADMWNKIRRDIDLEPETELVENVYLGCNQREVQPELQWLSEKNDLFKKLTTYAIAEGDPCDKKEGNQEAGQKPKVKELNADNNTLAGGRLQHISKILSKSRYFQDQSLEL